MASQFLEISRNSSSSFLMESSILLTRFAALCDSSITLPWTALVKLACRSRIAANFLFCSFKVFSKSHILQRRIRKGMATDRNFPTGIHIDNGTKIVSKLKNRGIAIPANVPAKDTTCFVIKTNVVKPVPETSEFSGRLLFFSLTLNSII